MLPPPAPRILLLAAGHDLAGWQAALGKLGQVWLDPASVPQGESADLLVLEAGRLPAADRLPLSTPAGVIAVGSGELPAPLSPDVVLPEDASPRELELACRLLAQVVGLRRQLQQRSQPPRLDEALSDALTGLPNRRAWEVELAARLSSAGMASDGICLALFDLDHFKQINDGWGLPVGDQVLVATAAALRDSLRQGDFVARLGGDEFAVLLSPLAPGAAASVLERVRADLPGRIARSTSRVPSASCGYAVAVGRLGTSPEALYGAAAAALRKAKQQGGQRTVGAELPSRSREAGPHQRE